MATSAMKWAPPETAGEAAATPAQAAPQQTNPVAQPVEAPSIQPSSAVQPASSVLQQPETVARIGGAEQVSAPAEGKPAKAGQANAQSGGLTFEAAIERVEGALRRLCVEFDKEGFFQEKVSTDLRGCEDYYERIKTPMWFSRVREKLRNREYRTFHQLQSEIELICSNAMTFNQKHSRVYKNAQNLLKGSRKQFLIEKSFLQEALVVLHPGGPEAAKADELEEEQALRAALPPKKPPIKPSKATKPPKKTAGTGLAGTASLPRSMSAVSTLAGTTSLAAGFDLSYNLGFLGDADDVLVDMLTEDDEGYSSFSDSDKEAQPVLERLGAVTERQSWAENEAGSGLSVAATLSAAATSDRSNAWKSSRRGVEWRIRWLEHRLREISHQQKRYQAKLDSAQTSAPADVAASVETLKPVGAQLRMPPPALPSSSVALPPATQYAAGHASTHAAQGPPAILLPEIRVTAAASAPHDGPSAAQAPLPPGSVGIAKGALQSDVAPMELDDRQDALNTTNAAAAVQKRRQRRRRLIARELGVEPLLDHPFFAAQAGLQRNKQIVREAEDADVSDEDENHAARAYAAIELLERQMIALRRQLCQPGLAPGLSRRGPGRVGSSRGVKRGPGLKVRQGAALQPREGKPTKRMRRTEGSGSDFILPGLGGGGSQTFERIKVADITIPKYQEHTAEELRARASILQRWTAKQEAKQQASQGPLTKEEDEKHARQDQLDASSSSGEETDDEAFLRLHKAMEDEERARYAGWTGGAQKKKNKNKHKPGVDATKPKNAGTTSAAADAAAKPALFGASAAPAAADSARQAVTTAGTLTPAQGGVGNGQPNGLPADVRLTATAPLGGATAAAGMIAGCPKVQQMSPMIQTVAADFSAHGRGQGGREGGRRGRPPGSFARGRGRARARGRPPSAGRGGGARTTRLPGPGRGHKTPKLAGTTGVQSSATVESLTVATPATVPSAVATPVMEALVAQQPSLSGLSTGAADSAITDPQGGVEVPITMAEAGHAEEVHNSVAAREPHDRMAKPDTPAQHHTSEEVATAGCD